MDAERGPFFKIDIDVLGLHLHHVEPSTDCTIS